MSFLTAEWRKLAIANYLVDPQALQEFVPKGTELDFWNSRCYVSIVGFRFINTELLGLRIPFHVNFEEVNLRFYVKRIVKGESRRGVVFIKEIVPRHAITFVANYFYQEHYQTLPMKHVWEIGKQNLLIGYSWKAANQWQSFQLNAETDSKPLEAGSETEFITEHYWGYTRVNDHHSLEYEVTHPAWRHYPVINSEIQVDFERTYGEKFAFLNRQEPVSLMLAEGSTITVKKKNKI